MRVYLDTSALVKLVQVEPESAALRRYLRRHRGDGHVGSALSRVELLRACQPGGEQALAAARRLLQGLDQVRLEARVLDDAATLITPSRLRSLDAIHLACARQVGAALRAVVTYDDRMAQAATALSLSVVAPS